MPKNNQHTHQPSWLSLKSLLPSPIVRRFMCKSKMKTGATEPNTRRNSISSSSSDNKPPGPINRRSTKLPAAADHLASSSGSGGGYGNYTSGSSYTGGSSITSISSSRTSLASLRDSLPAHAYVYDFSEISTATNNFLAKRFSSSGWKCCIRDKDVVVFQRKFKRSIETAELRHRLSFICKSHHATLVKLLGASISGDHIYLVYDFVSGANLADCLRNPKNPSYTVLANWMSRMQIATDIAQGLEYIHYYTGLNVGHVHNHIKSSSFIITEPCYNAKICHLGTAELCGEVSREEDSDGMGDAKKQVRRSDSRNMKFEGTRGYMSPEFQSRGTATQKSDVFAFGVVLLELLSGQEPLKYRFDKDKADYTRVSLIETATETMESDQPGPRLRRWVDGRLKDSFPLDVVEKVTRVALDCVALDPDKRPDMKYVAGKMSNLYLKSRLWADRINYPSDMITVSLAPR